MGKPRSHRFLEGDMVALRELGVDVLVSAMTPDERTKWGLALEEKAAVAAGLEFVEIPIPDRHVPDREAIADTITYLTGQYRAGRHVVFHCWAGIGRSSLLAASVLVQDGVTPDEAWDLISAARGYPVPDTDEQRAWLG
jgi:protein-tyrosine phosphatase